MKKWGDQPPIHFDEKELKTDLGQGNFIFVGSSCDMWAEDISDGWILGTLTRCKESPINQYLFQTKNPQRISNFISRGWISFPSSNYTFCTTIETNRYYPEIMGNAQVPRQRSAAMMELDGFNRIVTIEPIMDFDLDYLLPLIQRCSPWSVNIGANTNHQVKLPEPEPAKIKDLISALSEFTEVKIKNNLKRLLAGSLT